ncbi:cytochrome ubiquinol oxidase subunit I [Silanimonas sp.]|uniref:cytochrome ubiquinol oxidase subunit I n=1 Tax=Silanimonas sp. TaxID=1929290 RepID=UPI001BBD3102|nr:cytochrome ubiquinol oxidase subunit I [Silanimonas sp.]MBS3895670.1 cytochrome ubiquinol oxidase subunit I [Silanimonas sp.]MBS3958085.1 cytochrome ubiquinol oxidase subunit I [Xanthomonadaceae bacterium]
MFESLDPILLARIQFAANISFHILFPTITIGLAWVLLFFKWRFNKTGDMKWMEAYGFWVKVFALSFALGVVSGVVMSFQFGTNWPGFMNTVGNIAGPLLAYEIMTAFFLEATFLAVMLFGFRRVSNRIHTLATLLVAIGTSMSAFWILVLNSWMHTPVGFEMRDGVAHATDWMAIIFNPSMPYRFSHMMVASFLTVSFLIAGLSAWRWLRGDRAPAVLSAMRTGVYLGALLIPLQIVIGDLHGLNTLKYQPAKIAAIEAIWETDRGVPLVLFGFPDEEERTTHFPIQIPYLASIILTHEMDGELKGLNEFEGVHPPVAPVFFAFRIMVGIGMLMLVVGFWGAWRLKRHGTPTPLLAKTLAWMSFSGWVAVMAGWYTTEIGRQPWLVQDVLLTVDAGGVVPAPSILITLIGYLLVYLVLLVAYLKVIFYMAGKAGQRPETASAEGPGAVPFADPALSRQEG